MLPWFQTALPMPGVYVSYPFCAQKCSFCNFASGVFGAGLERDYGTALLAEIGAHRWEWTPDTVYLGGGTPSRMDEVTLAAILERIPGRPWREATVEAAPGTLTAQAVRAWLRLGIGRVSLGVQSFASEELRRTGRRHDAAAVAADCALLRAEGLTNFNIDLIAGLPHQTQSSWRESLDWIERLAPTHVSVYLFEVDGDSRLGLEVLAGGNRYGAGAVPSDDEAADFYEIAVERLARAGIPRYEISNFARPGFESAHNLKYWCMEPYVGFGADAHSFDGTARRGNVETAREYVERYRRGEPPCLAAEPASVAAERMFTGLRLSAGIAPTADEWRRYAAPLERFLDLGLLERDGAAVRLTGRGVLLSNEVFQEFLTA